ncbi:hypothetical protein PV325_008501 [Microctonus aethiopoides]|nr:hypothetical protein PV325_008501 [Microctonus aethiopoides]
MPWPHNHPAAGTKKNIGRPTCGGKQAAGVAAVAAAAREANNLVSSHLIRVTPWLYLNTFMESTSLKIHLQHACKNPIRLEENQRRKVKEE